MNDQITTTTLEELAKRRVVSRPTTRLAGRIAGFLRDGIGRIEACEHVPHLDRRHCGTLVGLFTKPQDGDHRSRHRPGAGAATYVTSAQHRKTGRGTGDR